MVCVFCQSPNFSYIKRVIVINTGGIILCCIVTCKISRWHNIRYSGGC